MADKLANEGADAVADGTHASRCDIHGNIIRPGIGDYHPPFDCNLIKKHKEAAIDYLRGVNTGVRAHSSLFLPEQYQVNRRLIGQQIPPKDLATVHTF